MDAATKEHVSWAVHDVQTVLFYALLVTLAVAAALLLTFGVIYFFFPKLVYEFINFQLRRAAKLYTKTTECAGYTWSYNEGGSRKHDTIVLVHGFSASKDAWSRFAKHLTAHYHVIVPDLPGHGDTHPSPPDATYDIEHQVERLHAFIVHVLNNPSRRYHVIGASMGGFIAGVYASKHPERYSQVRIFFFVTFVRSQPLRLRFLQDDVSVLDVPGGCERKQDKRLRREAGIWWREPADAKGRCWCQAHVRTHLP